MKSPESLKYQMVSNGIMNKQINIRLPQNLLASAKKYAQKNGYESLQELIKVSLREKLYGEEELTPQEMRLVKAFLKKADTEDKYGTEEELFRKLRR